MLVCITTEQQITGELDTIFELSMTCPIFTHKAIVSHLPATGTKRLSKKAFCIDPADLKQELVKTSVYRCVDLPEMTERKGVLVWTTLASIEPDAPDAFNSAQVPVTHLWISQVLKNGKQRHANQVIEGYNIDALQWHPLYWFEHDLYLACVTNGRYETITLNAALIDTWEH